MFKIIYINSHIFLSCGKVITLNIINAFRNLIQYIKIIFNLAKEKFK